jgi:hypothetical protein
MENVLQVDEMWSVLKEKRLPLRVNLADYIKMSHFRYQTILQYLTFADEPAAEDPVDLFWEVRPIIDTFKRNMLTYLVRASMLTKPYSSDIHLQHIWGTACCTQQNSPTSPPRRVWNAQQRRASSLAYCFAWSLLRA